MMGKYRKLEAGAIIFPIHAIPELQLFDNWDASLWPLPDTQLATSPYKQWTQVK